MADDERMTLGEYLEGARQHAGYSLRRLAEVTGIPTSRINRLLKNEVERPSPASLVRLAGALDLSAARLFALAGYPYPDLDDVLRTDYALSEDAVADVRRVVDERSSGRRS